MAQAPHLYIIGTYNRIRRIAQQTKAFQQIKNGQLLQKKGGKLRRKESLIEHLQKKMYGAEKIIIFRKGGIGTGRRGKDGGSGGHEFKQGVGFASGEVAYLQGGFKLLNIINIQATNMFQFGSSDQNTQVPIYTGLEPYFPLYRQQAQNQHHQTLQTLRAQTDYLVTEINGIKEVLGEFINEVRDRLNHLTENITQIQRINEIQRPRKKFKKAITCSIDDCGRKYSSKIALNCHIRTKHHIKKQ